ncbi:unnamed protein product [Angiostrongylus costaricensis]|uniref:Uncharacterized protein n=1 Tax=Angiostrongylus costaricensis TaxID=334426 RepID=A0A0R3PX25_ANGCS|nr:unnamed protein product [Angiostrongylus costaricensis]
MENSPLIGSHVVGKAFREERPFRRAPVPRLAVQMMFTWIGDEGVDIGFMRLSMYTTPGLLAILKIKSPPFLVLFLDDGLDRFSNPNTDRVSAYSIAAASDSDFGECF